LTRQGVSANYYIILSPRNSPPRSHVRPNRSAEERGPAVKAEGSGWRERGGRGAERRGQVVKYK
jgi:hypothetical protein